jgi:hypothetical protein
LFHFRLPYYQIRTNNMQILFAIADTVKEATA